VRGTLDLQITRRRAEWYPNEPGGPVLITSPVTLTAAQFLAIALSSKITS
jgi:hypothetical protein